MLQSRHLESSLRKVSDLGTFMVPSPEVDSEAVMALDIEGAFVCGWHSALESTPVYKLWAYSSIAASTDITALHPMQHGPSQAPTTGDAWPHGPCQSSPSKTLMST
ncbi:hypothetical protein E2C01_037599 [Portunus trituberculatus]|uniref:Uncharacterized protein n=1 Tax=Portunus trituberculatus TaxID=210409 RepID=A0A5B7F9S2_PORTR|nr:hypothetical protein [Portunus trituberculatus]